MKSSLSHNSVEEIQKRRAHIECACKSTPKKKHSQPGARESNEQVGQLLYQLLDWYGKLYILPYRYFLTAHCKPTV